MNLRLPASGSLVESLLSNLGRTVADSAGATSVVDATEPQLATALDALARGDVEFVILENGNDFLQAAGEAPFALQHSAGDPTAMMAASGGVDERTLRAAFSAYLHGDAGWRTMCRWDPL